MRCDCQLRRLDVVRAAVPILPNFMWAVDDESVTLGVMHGQRRCPGNSRKLRWSQKLYIKIVSSDRILCQLRLVCTGLPGMPDRLRCRSIEPKPRGAMYWQQRDGR